MGVTLMRTSAGHLSLDSACWPAFEYDTLPDFMQEHGLQPLGPTTS